MANTRRPRGARRTGGAVEHVKRAGIFDDVGSATYEDVRGLTSRLTGGNPAVAAALSGGVGALAGHYLGPRVVQTVTSGLNRIIPGRAPLDPYQSQREIARTRRNMALLGGALGVAPFLPAIWDAYKSGDLMGAYKEGEAGGMLSKQAQRYIDSAFAKGVVDEDPHLRERERIFARNIFNEAEQRSEGGKLRNLITTGDIARGAVGAGLGYGAAAVAAPMLSGIFGMPRGTINTLKRTGGLAGALRGSGIIG